MTRHYFITIFTLLISSLVYGVNPPENNTEKVYYQDGAIKITYVAEKCVDETKGKSQVNLIFSIQNLSDHSQEVSYYIEKQFETYCIGCGTDSEMQKVHTYTIAPNSTITGECFEVASGLSFTAGLDVPGAKSNLQSFEFRNLQVEQK